MVTHCQIERAGALSSRHRSNALEICSSRPSSVTIFSQKRHFGQFWPLKGASCVVKSTPGLVQHGKFLQSWSMLMASAEERKGSKPQSRAKEHTHGSVLMDMIKSQDQQPKELTVGAKGKPGYDIEPNIIDWSTCIYIHTASLGVLNLAVDLSSNFEMGHSLSKQLTTCYMLQ